MNHCVEIRSYELHAGRQAEFEQLFTRQVGPMMREWRIDVIYAGVSLHEEDTFVLIRAYPNVAERQASQEAFYGSSQWREGPRGAVLAAIASFTSAVIEVGDQTLAAMRADLAPSNFA
ncbi:MAG: NIPSNAP family protein [Sphingosinicella sp.]|nr:NIPSNAP family protein [Sphingosinicella sp.]